MEDEHHEGDGKQHMDETSGDLEGNSAAPKEQEKNGNDKEHGPNSRLALLPVVRFAPDAEFGMLGRPSTKPAPIQMTDENE